MLANSRFGELVMKEYIVKYSLLERESVNNI